MKFLLSAAFICLLAISVQAQAPASSASPTATPALNMHYWRAVMPAGTFVVQVSSITSISIHEYVLDGAARVQELDIGILGPLEARFYYLEPNTPQTPDGIGQSSMNAVQDKVQQAMQRGGSTEDAWEKVVKNYPVTTHAHTVEYRVDSADELQKIFNSVDSAWTHQSGITYTSTSSAGSTSTP